MKIGLFSREAFPSPFSPIFALQTPDVWTTPANHSKVKFKSGLSQLNDGAEASCLPAGRTRCSLQKAERLLHLWFFLRKKHKSNDGRQIWKCIEISLNWLFIKIAYNSAHILYGLANLHMFSCFLQSADFIFLFSEFRLGCEVTRLFSWNF